MTETYYYLWEFFTSTAILALIAIYIVYDRRQAGKVAETAEPAPAPQKPAKIGPEKKKNRAKNTR